MSDLIRVPQCGCNYGGNCDFMRYCSAEAYVQKQFDRDQQEIDRLKQLLADWQQWAEWFAGVHHRPDTSIQALKARTQEVLKP